MMIKKSKYKLKFIDSYRFIQSKLSDLVDNLSGIFNKECKSCIKCRCKKCKETWFKLTNKAVKNFLATCQFCNLNKFVLLLRKGIYPYEYMDSWKKFDDTSLPDKKAFYSKLNLEDIIDKDYKHAQKVWSKLEIKNLGKYHDLHAQSDTLLLADVFENFGISVVY